VISSLLSVISADEILGAYGLRTIMNFGDFPKKKEESLLAWLKGKLMLALLVEKYRKGCFSPSLQRSKIRGIFFVW